MAGMGSSLKNLVADARSRTLIIITSVLLVLAIAAGYWGLRSRIVGPPAKAQVAGVPTGIKSVPGALDPTAQYAKLQQEQNVEQAKQAMQKGTSAIPTIIRTQKFGEGQQLGETGNGLGFATLSRKEREGGVEKPLWLVALKASDCSVAAVKKALSEGATVGDLRQAGCSACQLKAAGLTAKQLLAGGFSADELRGAGFPESEIRAAEGLPAGLTADELRQAGCSVEALRRERAAGVSAKSLRDIVGCSAAALKAAGYTAKELRDAGFTPAELKAAGFTDKQLRDAGLEPPADDQQIAGLPPGGTAADVRKAGCSVEALKKERAAGVSASAIRQLAGCSAAALKAAGYTAKELKDAGFTAAQLKDAGFTAKQLKDAGFSAKQLKDAGFSAKELKDAGFSAKELKDAGFSDDEIRAAGYPMDELANAGIQSFIPGVGETAPIAATSDKALQQVLERQAAQISKQKLEQTIQNRQSAMSAQMGQFLTAWSPPTQVYVAGSGAAGAAAAEAARAAAAAAAAAEAATSTIIKSGAILFAVLDTEVNSDEPGPILATIVSGEFKGTKLIGSLSRPENAKRIILSFNTMSIPGVDNTVSINAVAIDPETAKTALADKVDSHYLYRYGSLFASAFMEGFGDSFSAEGTSVDVNGGTVQVQQVGRSLSENAIVGLQKVGERWGAAVAPGFNRPPTIKVYAGISLGIFFTSDVQVPLAPPKPKQKTLTIGRQ